MSAITKILARERGESAEDMTVTKVKGYAFIATPSHGYLCLGSEDNGYSDAIAIARRSSFSYILDGGLVFLEEDCDATEFLALGLENLPMVSVKATDLMESLGINVVRIK